MNALAYRPIACALDAQISVANTGGTETALLALLSALAESGASDPLLVLGLHGHGDGLRPLVPNGARFIEYPRPYRWFDPATATGTSPGSRWERLRRMAGPLRPLVDLADRHYAHGARMSPRAERLYRAVGPLAPLVPIAYRFWRGVHSRPFDRAASDRLLRAHGVAVVHFPYPSHFETRLPFVYEPWGLPHLHQREAFRDGEAEWFGRLVEDGCRQAALIVTATRWVKADIMRAYGLPSERIAVVPRRPRLPAVEKVAATVRPDLPTEFALFPAAAWPTKNHRRLLQAIALLRDRHGMRLSLVCTGRQDTDEWPAIMREVQTLGLADQVHFLGPIPFDDLLALYRSAKFLVHPSLFEGLGLPLLEAFHFGLPVVAANAACIPEVVGDAALLFDPRDPQAIAEALRRALTEPSLLAALRERGRARLANAFPDATRMAAMFGAVYRVAAGAPLSATQQALFAEMVA